MTTPARVHRRLLAGAGTATATAALAASGTTLPFPADLHPATLETWLSEVGAATATFTTLRALGVVLLAWVVLTACAGVGARRLRWTTATRALDQITLPVVRRFANGVAGAALVVTSVAGAATAGANPSSTTTPVAPVVTMHDLGPTPSSGSAPTNPPVPASSPPEASTTTVPPASSTTTTTDPPTTSSTTAATPPSSLAPTSTAPPPSMARRPVPPVTMRSLDQPAPPRQASGPQPQPSSRTTEAPATWTIASGDTLWHVAEQVASARAGSPADPEATLAELDRIVARNADRLVVPGNADLVFPGQVFLIA